MLPEQQIRSDFLDLFYHEIAGREIVGGHKLDVFVLKIQNNRFTYDHLAENLFDSIIPFCLSRKEMDRYKGGFGGRLYKTAVDKFRRYNSNDGELGEVLLYCLLESHLEAPKILSKMEIKTSGNDYVKGADGVHVLKLDGDNYQLVFGESKMRGKLSDGIREAFVSIKSFLTRRKGGLSFDVALVNSQLMKEAVDDQTYEFLKELLMPGGKTDANLDTSFGIFIGFDYKFDKEWMKLDNDEFRKTVRADIKNQIENCVAAIEKQIKDEELLGYDFYVYIIPFTDLDEKRKEVIGQITSEL